jgi:peptide/nickel transport system permease protein
MDVTRATLRFVVRRLLATLPVLAGAVAFTFVMLRLLPADPAAFLASGPGMGHAEMMALRIKLGLDQDILTQFVRYAGQIARGDLGRSFITGDAVASDLLHRLPASLELAFGGLLLGVLVALPLGIAAAARPGSAVDHLCRAVSVLGGALPPFVVGLGLIYLFYFRLGWAPEPTGQIEALAVPPPTVTGLLLIDSTLAADRAAFVSAAAHLALPSATMALFALAPLARITRAAMLAVLSSDYIRSARALGLPPRTVLLCYALGNALAPVLTALGLVFSTMLGANVVVEKVFAWPGIGAYALDALQAADYAAVQGFVLVVAAVFAVVNLAVDLLCGLIDPRAARYGSLPI